MQALKCFLYTLYYEIIKRLLGGFYEIRPIADQQGVVRDIDDPNGASRPDGDYCFDIVDINPEHDWGRDHWITLHCEITHCDRENLQTFIDDLAAKFRQKGPGKIAVSLDGLLSFDPAHLQAGPSSASALEIHPVHAARVIRLLP